MSDTDTIDEPTTAPAQAPASAVTATGAPPSDRPAAASASQPDTLPAADAIAKAMLSEAEKAAAIERDELLANGVDVSEAPRPQPLPGFEPPPFDLVGALRAIGSKNRAVASAKADWETAKEEASTLKKVYDREVDGLSAIIRDMEARQGDHVAHQPRLVPTGTGAQSCLYEQREGKPCPVCIALKAADAPLPAVDDTEHLARVDAIDMDPALLPFWISRVGGPGFVEADVRGWTDEQRHAVGVWCAAVEGLSEGANCPMFPDVRVESATFDGNDPTTSENLHAAMRAAKVCLCQDPAPKDGICTTCDGTITGPPAKKRKAR